MQYEHVKPEAIDKYLESLNLSTRGNPRDRADRLDAYFRAQHEKGVDVLVCDVCDGHSPAELNDCPYCGESGVDFTRTKPISDVDDDTGIQDKTVYYIEDLDRIQRELYRGKRAVSDILYRLGKLLAEVRGKALWRLRRKRTYPNGPVYQKFTEWVDREGHFSVPSADRLIKMTGRVSQREFQSLVTEIPACIRTWDLKKRAGLDDIDFSGVALGGMRGKPILRHNDEDGFHIEIYEESPDGKISVELDQDDGSTEIVCIPEALIRTPVQRRFTRPVRPENRMERVDLNIGMSRVTMWKRGHRGTPARVLDDDPWFELPLNEAVKLEVRLIRGPDGALEAICETKRKRGRTS
jgi:hypothetical protein